MGCLGQKNIFIRCPVKSSLWNTVPWKTCCTCTAEQTVSIQTSCTVFAFYAGNKQQSPQTLTDTCFSSHVVPTFNHGHAVCKCDLTETHRAEHNLRGPRTKGLAGNLGLVSISNVQSCSFNSTGNTKLSHIIVIKS